MHYRFRLSIITLRAVPVAALLFFVSAARAGQAPAVAAKTLGVATCASAVCHGSLVPREGGNILRNEYVVWSEKDHHSRAYNVLLGERSRSIAARLGIGAASEAPVCLDCHATNPAADERGEKFRSSDGVSCESCHGSAGNWLESHDDPARTHAQNVAAGMTDLSDAATRAETCSSCHVGDARRFVTHRIMAAGHPRTGFELDTFSFIQPRHYRVDDDYRRRKGEPTGAVSWAVGQSALVAHILERIAAVPASAVHDRSWPEFALFDCFSCHHPMDPSSGASRPATTLGTPSLLRANAAMLALAVDAASLPADARIDASLLGLDAALARGGGDVGALAAQALARVRRAEQTLDHWTPTKAQLETLLAALSSPETVAAYDRSYGDAEQATMAVQAVVASLVEIGARKDDGAARLKQALDGLFAATRSEEAFRRDAFAVAMHKVDTAR